MTTSKVISRNATSSELDSEYKWGFTMDIESDLSPKGLSEAAEPTEATLSRRESLLPNESQK